MSSQLELAKLRLAVASLPAEQAEGLRCPELETIWQAARGEIPTDDLKTLALHSAACGSCAQSWRLAREIQSELDGAGAGDLTPRSSRFWGGLSLMAALALIAFAVWLWSWPQSSPEPVMRAQPGLEIVSLVPEGAALPREAFLLRWDGSNEPVGSSVRLLTLDLNVVFEAETGEEREVTVPAAALAPYPDRTELIWIVSERHATGEVVEHAFRVRVGPEE